MAGKISSKTHRLIEFDEALAMNTCFKERGGRICGISERTWNKIAFDFNKNIAEVRVCDFFGVEVSFAGRAFEIPNIFFEKKRTVNDNFDACDLSIMLGGD